MLTLNEIEKISFRRSGLSGGYRIEEVTIEEETYIWADGYQVEEVVKNYLSNAINHVDDNKAIKA